MRLGLATIDDSDWYMEYQLRLNAMETETFDGESLLGIGTTHNRIMLNVEVNPPGDTNTKRARRLNPERSIRRWLSEMAEQL